MSVWCQSMSSELLFYSASELWYWRRLLRVTWTEGRSNQSILKEINWIFIGRIDAEAEAPIFWPPDVKSWLTGKDPDAGKDWRQVEKGATEDEMVGWQHWPNGHAAAAKSLQPCPTLCDRQQPTSLPCPQDSPGKNASGLPFPSPLHESSLVVPFVAILGKLGLCQIFLTWGNLQVIAQSPATTWNLSINHLTLPVALFAFLCSTGLRNNGMPGGTTYWDSDF